MRRLARLLIFLGLFMGGNACADQALSSCLILRLEVEAVLHRATWQKREPISLLAKDGSSHELRFSFDSELPFADAVRAVQMDRKVLQNLRADPRFSLFTKSELRKRLQVSDAQFERFVLKAGTPKDLVRYSMFDLNPFYAGQLIDIRDWVNNMSRESLAKALESSVQEALIARDYPIRTSIDLNGVEVKHETSEASPEEFGNLIRRLYWNFKSPQTHLHLGLPTAVISAKEADEIGRIVEMQSTIAMFADDGSRRQVLDMIHGSTFENRESRLKNGYPFEVGKRGVVRVTLDRFSKPERMHDLEVRQYVGIDHGMKLLSFAAKLAGNHEALRPAGGWVIGTPDRNFAYLAGAFSYAEKALSASSNPSYHEIAREIEALLTRIPERQSGGFPDQLIPEASRIVKKYKLDQVLLDPDLYIAKTP